MSMISLHAEPARSSSVVDAVLQDPPLYDVYLFILWKYSTGKHSIIAPVR